MTDPMDHWRTPKDVRRAFGDEGLLNGGVGFR